MKNLIIVGVLLCALSCWSQNGSGTGSFGSVGLGGSGGSATNVSSGTYSNVTLNGISFVSASLAGSSNYPSLSLVYSNVFYTTPATFFSDYTNKFLSGSSMECAPGTYTLTNFSIVMPVSSRIHGSGNNQTIFVWGNSNLLGCGIEMSSYCEVSDCYIQTTVTNALSLNIGRSENFSFKNITNAIIRNCRFLGYSDNIYFSSTNSNPTFCSVAIINPIFESHWDCMAFRGPTSATASYKVFVTGIAGTSTADYNGESTGSANLCSFYQSQGEFVFANGQIDFPKGGQLIQTTGTSNTLINVSSLITSNQVDNLSLGQLCDIYLSSSSTPSTTTINLQGVNTSPIKVIDNAYIGSAGVPYSKVNFVAYGISDLVKDTDIANFYGYQVQDGTSILFTNTLAQLTHINGAWVTNLTAYQHNGGGLTNLNAGNLASGTVPLSVFPSSVITNGNSQTWTNLGNVYFGSSGNSKFLATGNLNVGANQLNASTRQYDIFGYVNTFSIAGSASVSGYVIEPGTTILGAVGSSGMFLSGNGLGFYQVNTGSRSGLTNITFLNATASGTITSTNGFIGPEVVNNKTANYTILNSDSGSVFYNTGAAGPVTNSYSVVTNGYWNEFYIKTAQNMAVKAPAGCRILYRGQTSVDGGLIYAAGVGMGFKGIWDNTGTNFCIQNVQGLTAAGAITTDWTIQ